jgi:hypothetical protein
MKLDVSQSQKAIIVKKDYAKSIKTLNKILPYEGKQEKSDRYSNNMLSNTRINFKSSRKLNASRSKKMPLQKKLA